jgi:DNA phosphorothioation-dependent restriction protein DptH
MSALATEIARQVRERMAHAIRSLPAGQTELRSIFHGPPMPVMQAVQRQLSQPGAMEFPDSSGRLVALPLMLQVPAGLQGFSNPMVGESGSCDESHLLVMRDSPDCPRFLALVPPGLHRNLSIESTTWPFGLSAAANFSNATFEDWWSDPFVQELVGVAVGADEQARALVHAAARSADAIDQSGPRRAKAWEVLARVFSLGTSTDPMLLAAACGYPPTADNVLRAREQLAVLANVADAVEGGLAQGIARAMQNATDDDDRRALDDCLAHLRRTCELVTEFKDGAPAFYGPCRGSEVVTPPWWWTHLTTERWRDLLDEGGPDAGEVRIACINSLVAGPARAIAIVRDEAILELRTSGNDGAVQVTVERRAGPGARGSLSETVAVDKVAQWPDRAPPRHKAPIRYKASAERFGEASAKVISLASWRPGIVVWSRLASKLSPPKEAARGNREKIQLESSLEVNGAGRIYLDVFVGPGVSVEVEATGRDMTAGERGSEDAYALPLVAAGDGRYGLEVDASEEYEVDIYLNRGSGRETCRLYVSCKEGDSEGCRSELERLIRLNKRGDAKARGSLAVEIDRGLRCNQLQAWMLEEQQAEHSWRPLVLADDYATGWAPPDWKLAGKTIMSAGEFLHDPRPAWHELEAPAPFLSARSALAKAIRGPDQGGLVEAARLGELYLRDTEFQQLLEQYLDSYIAWLRDSPDIASWADVILVASRERDGRTLVREPDAILVSPLHPARLSWHCLAQATLQQALDEGCPCPAASVLDPDCVPDLLTLPLRSAAGTSGKEFFSVECSSDYWAVLCNGTRLGHLVERSRLPPFDREFGVKVGGVSSGFSSAQVGRALRDVSDMLSAKLTLGVAISSGGGAADACNEGLLDWCRERFGTSSASGGRVTGLGQRVLQVFDTRDAPDARPDDATVAALSEDTGNAVRWFQGRPERSRPDLGIIAQLDSSHPEPTTNAPRSALSAGALLRQRIRRQLAGGSQAFLSESRQGQPAPPCGDALADKVAHAVASLENKSTTAIGLTFAPNVLAVRRMLEEEQADFVAVSSSSIDPSCFLGRWLEGAYLWDYDLPSYSQRAGDTNGYYLLSKAKEVDRDALGRAVARLPGCTGASSDALTQLLLEVARRGIPTVKGMSSDDSGATGSLGLFVGVRLLQDEFRSSRGHASLMPVLGGTEDEPEICIVVPVDPFREHLEDLHRALHHGKQVPPLSRPDLLVACISIRGAAVRLRLTPIEVKFRQGTMSAADCKEALGQAEALSSLLQALEDKAAAGPLLWKLALQHLLATVIGFGLRVYSQHGDVQQLATRWSEYHQAITSALLGGTAQVEIDPAGRLVLVDSSQQSEQRDCDDDGFSETLVVSLGDAGRIVAGDPGTLYSAIRSSLHDWRLRPTEAAGSPPTSQSSPTPPALLGDPGGPGDGGPNSSSGSVPSDGTSPTGEPPRAVNASAGGEGEGTGAPPAQPVIPEAHVPACDGIQLLAGRTTGGFEPRPVRLDLSDTRLNQLNIGVVGDLGTGKTQLLKSLILQIASSSEANRGIKPRFLIFDYKKDYSGEDFVRATGARVVKPHRLPLNLFDTSEISDSAAPWLDRYRFFADVLDKIYSGIGPVQRNKLKQAVRSAYEAAEVAGKAPTIYEVHAEYKELMGGKPDSPLGIIDDLVDMEVFAREPGEAAGFDKFLDGVVVVSLASLGQDDRTKNLLVAVMLNMFYEYMLRIPKRPFLGQNPQLRAIDSYLLVDEADNIMRYEFDVLRKVLLQGREFGAGVILASQYLRHFKVNGTDYRDPLLTWFIHKVPNVTPAELSALGFTADVGELAERVKSLPNHHCLFKSHDSAGQVIRGTPFYELVDQGPRGHG